MVSWTDFENQKSLKDEARFSTLAETTGRGFENESMKSFIETQAYFLNANFIIFVYDLHKIK